MLRALQLAMSVCVISSIVGCSMCDDLEDSNYPTFGGKWERADQRNGRVGSAFEPAEKIDQAAEEVTDDLWDELDQIPDIPQYGDEQDPPPSSPPLIPPPFPQSIPPTSVPGTLHLLTE